MRSCRSAACGLAEEHHVRWVAAESSDVVVHPLQAHPLVQHAKLAGDLVCYQKAKSTKTVIGDNHNHTVLLGQVVSVVQLRHGTALFIATLKYI